MREDFILDYRGVVMYEDVFDGDGGDFGEEDTAEGVGDGGVDSDEGEGRVEGFILVKLDFKGIPEFREIPGVVLAGVVVGEVG